jgi:hypothetical protein
VRDIDFSLFSVGRTPMKIDTQLDSSELVC